MADGQFGDALAGLHVLVQPLAQGIAHHAGNEGGAFPRGQPFLGLAQKLGVVHFYREQVGAAIPDVLRAQLDAAGQQVARLAEFPEGFQQALAQTVHVSAALGGGHQVHVTLRDQVARFRQPVYRPVHLLVIALHVAGKRFHWQQFNTGQHA